MNHRPRAPEPTRLRCALQPTIGLLEPRIVLNATAELNAMGQLMISGGDVADTVKLEVNSEEQLQLRDGAGEIIPIAGHPDEQTDPLDPSAITSGQIFIDLGGGDDALDLQIPSSLSVTVVDGLGTDTTAMSFQTLTSPQPNRILNVASEQVSIDSSSGIVDLRGTETQLSGNVLVGTRGLESVLRLDNSALSIDGSLTIAGNTTFSGSNAQVDLSSAVLSASTPGNDLRILLGADSNDHVMLGVADDSAGEHVNDLLIDSAQSLQIDATAFDVANGISIRNIAGPIEVHADVTANQIEWESEGPISITGSIIANAGNLSIRSASTIELSGQLDSSASTTTTGDIAIDGESLRFGDLLATTGGGTISLVGPLQLDGDVTFNAGAIRVLGAISGQTGTQSLNVIASGDVHFDGALADFANLSIDSGGAIAFRGPVSLSGHILATAADATIISTSSIQTAGSQQYRGELRLLVDGVLSASSVKLGSATNVVADKTYSIDTSLVDDDVEKTGLGTLVLADRSRASGTLTIHEGTLRVDGEITDDTKAVNLAGGDLEGDGRIHGPVIALQPGSIRPGSPTGQLTVGSLLLQSSTEVAFQWRGPGPGVDHDQIVVDPQRGPEQVQLNGALLNLDFSAPAQAATEYVLIVHQGSDPVTGGFTFDLSSSGERLASPRGLGEGDLVLQDFGGSGRPAYITYAGGDGNDVAIVTAGDVDIEAENVTLIQRRGSNLEIRTGNDLESAQTATPVIRPIAAVNEYQIRILGSPANQSLFVDVDKLVDPAPGAVQYTGEIVFSGDGPGDSDSITLLDSDRASVDTVDSVVYGFDSINSGNLQVTTGGALSAFAIRFTDTELISQAIMVPVVDFQYSGLDERIEIALDPDSPLRTRISSSGDGGQLPNVSLENPTKQLSIRGGGGDDLILISGFGSGGDGFAASLSLEGEQGDDAITIASDILLGRDDAPGSFVASAETIAVNANLSTTGGDVDGQILLTGGESVRLTQSSTIESGTASIHVDAAGGRFDSRDGFLVSNSSNDAVVIANASTVELGNVDAINGRLNVNTDALTGDIRQAAGTRILADELIVDAFGSVQWDNTGNDFRLVESILARGEVTIRDSFAGLDIVLIDSRGNEVSIATPGILGLSAGAIVATDATVNLTAGASVIDRRMPEDSDANVSAGTVNLLSGSGGIGAAEKPIVLSATGAVNADASASHSSIHLRSPAIPLLIGLVNAGRGEVALEAVSIQDAASDELADIVAGQLRMSAQSGIGSAEKLELQAITELSATTLTGGIRLDHASADNLNIRLLQAEEGSIELRHAGSDSLSIERISSGSGDVAITHRDGSIEVVGEASSGESISIANRGSVTLTALGTASAITLDAPIESQIGNISLTADENLLLNSQIKTSNGKITLNAGGSIEVMDSRIDDAAGDARSAAIESQIGDISLTADENILLNSQIKTSNGKITLNADVSIEVMDSRIDDAEIMAGGNHGKNELVRGKIELDASQSIELVGETLLQASETGEKSILLDASSIVLSSEIRLLTGDGVGSARFFSPRPMPGLADTAFFDFTTVETSPLTQRGANNAVGVLSVLVGRPGENGLTIDIDWGDSRSTVAKGLPGHQFFTREHVYSESDIVRSRANGRTSATDPLQVRFSVRHHESIVVRGDTIQQAAFDSEGVAGGLISSTDDPTTMALRENGTATFNIPNLTISVPFFPVRQIIPEPVQPEIFTRPDLPQFLTNGVVETETTSVSPAVSRDEYLQLRVLSLEPGGEDLTAPQRLPVDVLVGDNLEKLFAKLPDGKYEIQYVLGGGNDRTLLRFDLRNHEPVVPGEELDGSQLKLKPIDLDVILHELQEELETLENLPQPALPEVEAPDESFEIDQAEPAVNGPLSRTEASVAVVGMMAMGSILHSRSRRFSAHSACHSFSVAGRFLRRTKHPQ